MSKTLLLADDSVTIQKVVGISFASEDVTLVTVDNGDDAIARAREVRPDVVLADVVMPGKSGYEVCEALKADPALSHVPVLLLTGTFEAFDEERARRVGAAGHIAKPFEAQALVEEVKRLLAAAPAAAAAPAGAAPAPASDDAFDFFDDEAGELGADDPIVQAEPAETDPLDLEGPDGAFAFGGSDVDADGPLELDEPEIGGAELAAEHTVAMVADEEPALAETTIGEDDLASIEPPDHPAPAAAPFDDSAPDPLAPMETAPAGDVFDFDLDDGAADDAPLRVDSDDLAQATVLDPMGASGFDVSTSDLVDPLEAELDAAPPAAEPAQETVFAPESRPEIPVMAAAEAIAEPIAVADADPVEEAEPDRLGTEPQSAPTQPGLAEIAPQLREQLHDTLEKIAWDSFSDVTEKIVRQALERVEAVAWEVIPQLAEALVREEIRRMKGETQD